MNRSIAIASATVLLWAGVSIPQDAITLKFKKTQAGASVHVVESYTVAEKLTIKKDGIQKGIKFTESIVIPLDYVHNFEYTEKVLENDRKGIPVRLERAYTKATATKDKKPDDLMLAGKSLVIEKIAGKYAFFVNGDEMLKGPAAELLKQEFADMRDVRRMDRLLLPKTPVKVGAPWKLDVGAILKNLKANDPADSPTDIDLAKATGTGVLRKAYMKDDKRFGVLEFRVEYAVKSIGPPEERMTFAPGVNEVITITFDGCIDGSSEAGVAKIKIELNGAGTHAQLPGAAVTIYRVDEFHTTVTDLGKK